VPAYRRRVAYEWIGDHRRRVEQNGVTLPNGWRGIEVRLPRQCADPEHPIVLGDVAEPRDAIDVYDERRLRESQLEHRDQALAPREDLRVVVLVEQGDCVVDGGGSDVVEGRRNHARLLWCMGRARLWGTGPEPLPTLESLPAGRVSMRASWTAAASARSSIG